MKKIKEWFENDWEKYDIVEYDGHLEVNTNIVRYLIVGPHSGTNNKWLLRVTTISAFDRWANSTAMEMFFETDIELCFFLEENQLSIYKDLLAYLSMEYDELEESVDE